MSRHRLPRRVANYLVTLALAYGLVAYMAAPEFWTVREHDSRKLPEAMMTTTPQGIPGDPINVGLVGSKPDLMRAFAAAGWNPADAITWRSSLEIGESVLFDRPYADAPVSTLLFDGRRQDVVFEKSVGASANQRHHVRLWMIPPPDGDDRPLWLGSASFDRDVGLSHDTGQITHHIGPDIDAERDLLISDLKAAGAIEACHSADGVGATQTGRNGGGDRYFTDGMATICDLNRKP
jgi:hypothetical protein